jgi:hypothetical protein
MRQNAYVSNQLIFRFWTLAFLLAKNKGKMRRWQRAES